MDNLYEILQVNEGASLEEIRKSYLRLARLHHPDKLKLKSDSEVEGQHDARRVTVTAQKYDPSTNANSRKLFEQLSYALEILSEEDMRQDFDTLWAERCCLSKKPISRTSLFSELEYNDEDECFVCDCECSGLSLVSKLEAYLRFDLIQCTECSKIVKLEYRVKDNVVEVESGSGISSSSGASSSGSGDSSSTVGMEDLYEILQVSKDASLDDIRKSYLRLALLHDPNKDKDKHSTYFYPSQVVCDKDKENTTNDAISASTPTSTSNKNSLNNSSTMFVKLNHAWKILSNGELRHEYDIKWKERCLHQTFPIQENVSFTDFEFNDEDECFVYDCRCGSLYFLSKIEAGLRYDLVCCSTCSLTIQVEYEDEETLEEELKTFGFSI